MDKAEARPHLRLIMKRRDEQLRWFSILLYIEAPKLVESEPELLPGGRLVHKAPWRSDVPT
jgi:hypothetical protein